jgi:hypothetical protein
MNKCSTLKLNVVYVLETDQVAKRAASTKEQVAEIVRMHIRDRQFGILEELKVHVLYLNIPERSAGCHALILLL